MIMTRYVWQSIAESKRKMIFEMKKELRTLGESARSHELRCIYAIICFQQTFAAHRERQEKWHISIASFNRIAPSANTMLVASSNVWWSIEPRLSVCFEWPRRWRYPLHMQCNDLCYPKLISLFCSAIVSHSNKMECFFPMQFSHPNLIGVRQIACAMRSLDLITRHPYANQCVCWQLINYYYCANSFNRQLYHIECDHRMPTIRFS